MRRDLLRVVFRQIYIPGYIEYLNARGGQEFMLMTITSILKYDV